MFLHIGGNKAIFIKDIVAIIALEPPENGNNTRIVINRGNNSENIFTEISVKTLKVRLTKEGVQ